LSVSAEIDSGDSDDDDLIPVVSVGDRSLVHRVLVGKAEGKRPLGRPRRIWEDIIKMNIQDVR
jgi:hypothetical protein